MLENSIAMVFEGIILIIKLPFMAFFKSFFTLLNLISLDYHELFSLGGYTANDRPDLRAQKHVVKGNRKVHLGMFIIAWCRGAVFEGDINREGAKCKGIWTEVYQDIQSKWIW